MCIFTSEIDYVSSTRIFARIEGHRQAIIYAMYLSTDDDTAMVLPKGVRRVLPLRDIINVLYN